MITFPLPITDRRDFEEQVRQCPRGPAEKEAGSQDADAQVRAFQASHRHRPRLLEDLAGLLRVRRQKGIPRNTRAGM